MPVKPKPVAKPKRATAVAREVRWTAATRATFLSALAELANVAAAARAADVPERSPYQLKQCDAAFAEAWDVAIDEGYNRLELMLLRRATFGELIDGEEAPAISTSFALSLLKARQVVARRGPPKLPPTAYGAELRDELDRKLADLARRRAGHG